MKPEELRRELIYARSAFNNPWLNVVLIIVAVAMIKLWM
jgi:hypothetical protein